MSAMKWTDLSIDTYLQSLELQQTRGGLTAAEVLLRDSLLELKRVRAWARVMQNHLEVLAGSAFAAKSSTFQICSKMLNGDPAPSEEATQ